MLYRKKQSNTKQSGLRSPVGALAAITGSKFCMKSDPLMAIRNTLARLRRTIFCAMFVEQWTILGLLEQLLLGTVFPTVLYRTVFWLIFIHFRPVLYWTVLYGTVLYRHDIFNLNRPFSWLLLHTTLSPDCLTQSDFFYLNSQ